MRRIRATAIFLAAGVAWADDGVRRALDRLAEEASAFQSIASDVIGRETLRQRAVKPAKRRFRPSFSNAPAPAPEWQEREIESEYGFAMLGGGLREFRRPLAVDGRAVAARAGTVEQLGSIIQRGDEKTRRRLLEDFERLGLIGTATDFGQILLMFDARGQQRFEFRASGTRLTGAEPVLVISYRQTSGGGGVTMWSDSQPGATEPARGEIWARASDGLPLRITIATVFAGQKGGIRQEAEIDYAASPLGALLPAAVVHRELRAGGMTAENRFTYSAFRKFSASSNVGFSQSQ